MVGDGRANSVPCKDVLCAGFWSKEYALYKKKPIQCKAAKKPTNARRLNKKLFAGIIDMLDKSQNITHNDSQVHICSKGFAFFATEFC